LVSEKAFIKNLHLNVYKAAQGDLPSCGDDRVCREQAKMIQELSCVIDVCDGKAGARRPIECFDEDLEVDKRGGVDLVDQLSCKMVQAPDLETRRKILKVFPEDTEANIMRWSAYAFALNGDAASCQKYIKNYVGPYNSNWSFQWYAVLSGCRIIAFESTLEEEEKDFAMWLHGDCSKIAHSELRNACNTPGTSPRQLPIKGL
jgi:hypothetical protein